MQKLDRIVVFNLHEIIKFANQEKSELSQQIET
jgi:hypothetical protein